MVKNKTQGPMESSAELSKTHMGRCDPGGRTLACMHQVLGLSPSPVQTRSGGVYLPFQHLGGRSEGPEIQGQTVSQNTTEPKRRVRGE